MKNDELDSDIVYRMVNPWMFKNGAGSVLSFILLRIGIKKNNGCGCARRQAWLDKHFPLLVPTTPWHP